VLAWRGEKDPAFEWLDKAVEYHDTGLVEIPVEPMFANIQNDPRYLPFLRKLGKAPEQLAVIKFDMALPKDARQRMASVDEWLSRAIPALWHDRGRSGVRACRRNICFATCFLPSRDALRWRPPPHASQPARSPRLRRMPMRLWHRRARYWPS
jgi:hypothetical protein